MSSSVVSVDRNQGHIQENLPFRNLQAFKECLETSGTVVHIAAFGQT